MPFYGSSNARPESGDDPRPHDASKHALRRPTPKPLLLEPGCTSGTGLLSLPLCEEKASPLLLLPLHRQMARKKKGRPHHPLTHGGRPKKDGPLEELPTPARKRSWQSGRKGQGGEGFSEGYGGSGGAGTGPVGPERKSDRPPKSG